MKVTMGWICSLAGVAGTVETHTGFLHVFCFVAFLLSILMFFFLPLVYFSVSFRQCLFLSPIPPFFLSFLLPSILYLFIYFLNFYLISPFFQPFLQYLLFLNFFPYPFPFLYCLFLIRVVQRTAEYKLPSATLGSVLYCSANTKTRTS
jgi:hypothetical protein